MQTNATAAQGLDIRERYPDVPVKDWRNVLDSIHHVAVSVPEYRAAVSWYEKTFDVTVAYADEVWALLDFDNTHLALILPTQHPPHFAVVRDDAETLGQLTVHRDGTSSVYVEDPWGNLVELMKPAAVLATD
tara:strand:- start:898 stop:1293 length:396 start_codon:yes stop_codon:yes gene_type:complete